MRIGGYSATSTLLTTPRHDYSGDVTRHGYSATPTLLTTPRHDYNSDATRQDDTTLLTI
jgi:hypothetical protein